MTACTSRNKGGQDCQTDDQVDRRRRDTSKMRITEVFTAKDLIFSPCSSELGGNGRKKDLKEGTEVVTGFGDALGLMAEPVNAPNYEFMTTSPGYWRPSRNDKYGDR